MPAYTKPEKSWSVDEMATAALLNQYQRDSMAATLHRIAYKTNDETVTNSTTLQDDNHLVWDAPPNTVWYLRLMLWCSQPSVTSFVCDMKLAFTFSTGTLTMSSWGLGTGGGIARPVWTVSGTSQAVDAINGTATKTVHVIEGIHTVTTDSTLRVQWAQNTADLGGLIVYAGSTLWGANVT